MTVEVGVVGGRRVATVSGELDLDSAHMLRHGLGDALRAADDVLELDLTGVHFCDCSALNVLLLVRKNAREASKSLVLRASSPAVQRLLELTGAAALFPAVSPEDDLAAENAHPHRALETRGAIDTACGMLMASFGLDPEQAWRVLVTVSRQSDTRLHVIADSLLQSKAGRPLSEFLAAQLAAAVEEHGTRDAG
ncbi:anti-sigma factor antagonist [Streptomyces sp. MBT53]|uniref:anti-sigma factor antagonist n=1 Tax=Streptomyces sp. MBT53 TaxID=1488384 RepID=UPI0027DA6EFC|nr:anti-sigma factor antagonist [Streptomyces sp. MBT53]